MRFSWLHVSDFHFKGGDPYDRDVVLGALVAAVRRYRDDGWRPDLVFATGDVADRGSEAEYQAATGFFDALLDAAGVEKRHLFVIPGNHDVDRAKGKQLERTLAAGKDADEYFGPEEEKVHFRKQQAFTAWYGHYFNGIRSYPIDSTCGPVEVVELAEARVGMLPVNSALFCQDDNDHGKLWVGRRCLDEGVKALAALATDVNVALVHHPLEWLHHAEAAKIRIKLQSHAHVILRGHLHETDVVHAAGVTGEALHMAAGAAYQGSEWPNCALYVRVEDDQATVFPIRYEDKLHEVWTVDPSVFPHAPDHCGRFPIPRRADAANQTPSQARADVAGPGVPFRCNVPTRLRGMPFVGRDELLTAIAEDLGESARQAVLVLRGPSGVGKSELAREFARLNAERYPGGRIVLDAGGEGPEVELARIGTTLLDLAAPPAFSADQALRALRALAGAPTLLVYDNVRRPGDVEDWLPPDGMPCHVLITSTFENWGPGWPVLDVPPLDDDDAIGLVRAIAGDEAADRFGGRLAQQAGGLPVQIVPTSAKLRAEARRGRLDEVELRLSEEADESFRGVYDWLDTSARVLLHTAARFNPLQIPRDEIELELTEALGWSPAALRGAFDACLDLYLLQQEGPGLRMHQLVASFLRGQPPAEEVGGPFARVLAVQARRLAEAARGVLDNPADAARVGRLLAFPVEADAWEVGRGG